MIELLGEWCIGTKTMLETKNQNVIQRANERGVVAARRHVSAEGQITLQAIADAIQPTIRNMAHLKNVERSGVNIIGFARFDQDHQDFGPRTKDITQLVDSTHQPLQVRLGHIGVYGSETRSKLGISLISDELRIEEEAIESVFDQKGFAQQPGPYREKGFVPHVSIARVNLGLYSLFQEQRTLDALDDLAGLGSLATQSVFLELDPIRAESMTSDS